MKLLHISTALSWRGGEQQLAYLLEGMQHREAVKQLVFCFKHSEIEKFCLLHNIPVITAKRSSAFNPFLAKEVSTVCAQNQIDLIHAHDSHAHTVAVLAALLFAQKTGIILSRKVDFPLKKNFFTRYKYNHPSIKKIICVSNKIAEIISPDLRNKDVLCTIYDGIDLSRFSSHSSGILRKQYQVEANTLLIGNVAAIAAHKDYYTFVDTAAELLSKNIKAKFFIIGDGPERKNIEAYITQKNLSNEIILCGFRTDISSLLPELDVFLFTSKTEGLGSSILDAYACSVPVVATAAGGIPEIVIHGKTGLLSAPQNSHLLAANVLALIESTTLRKELINEALSWVKNFSKEKNAEASYRVYQEILN